MQKKSSGANYAPKGKVSFVVSKGSFKVAVVGLDHNHIYGMCNGLSEAGAEISMVWDPDHVKVETFLSKFPSAIRAEDLRSVLESDVDMVACAAINAERAAIGVRVLRCGKHFFCDKPSVTTLEDLEALRSACEETGKRFFTYFSERLHVEAAVYAEKLVSEGTIGRVIQVMGVGPHRIGAEEGRPNWFWDESRSGGILCDIGCHQIEQILFFAGAKDARIEQSRICNYNHRNHPLFNDFGDVTLTCDNGVAGYFRVDWFTPDGLGSWGDGRTLILGTEGYIELRKYLDVANSEEGDQVYYVNKDGEHHVCVAGKMGYPFFGRMILDCINGTDTAMDQDHVFTVMKLAIMAQNNALKIDKD